MNVDLGARLRRISAGLAVVAVSTTAQAADLDLQAIGYTSNLYLSQVEADFFSGPFKEAAGDTVEITVVPHDLAGLKGTEVLALLQDGTLQIAVANLSYMAGDDPRFEALDLSGVTLTSADARTAYDAYRPVLTRIMEEKFNTHLLGVAPLPSQVFWCRDELTGLSDLEGRKIRVFNATLSDFVAGVGGTTVTMPFVEVIPALQQGVADCAVTGTSSGNSAKWTEVTDYLFPMNVGWSMVFWAANKDLWDSMTPEQQTLLTEQYDALAEEAWEVQIAQDNDAVGCSTGGECELGVPAEMTLVEVSDEDKALRETIVAENVLPAWAARCGADCVTEWNETVGAALGIEAPLP